jgi:rod shape-determining protein MreC
MAPWPVRAFRYKGRVATRVLPSPVFISAIFWLYISILPEGVIGQVFKTAFHHSTILLITDYNSAIDSVVQRTRAKAIVEGKGENRCQLKFLLRTEEVLVGDILVTSGLSGNFPKGLMVGEVQRVDKKGHGVFQYAELVPRVDLTNWKRFLLYR